MINPNGSRILRGPQITREEYTLLQRLWLLWSDCFQGNIYISGPITGITLHNRPAFAAAAHEWRLLGYAVIDPAVNYDSDTAVAHAQYMRLSIAQLLCVDVVYMLRGWAHSKGAVAEHVVAQALGLDISYQ